MRCDGCESGKSVQNAWKLGSQLNGSCDQSGELNQLHGMRTEGQRAECEIVHNCFEPSLTGKGNQLM